MPEEILVAKHIRDDKQLGTVMFYLATDDQDGVKNPDSFGLLPAWRYKLVGPHFSRQTEDVIRVGDGDSFCGPQLAFPINDGRRVIIIPTWRYVADVLMLGFVRREYDGDGNLKNEAFETTTKIAPTVT